MAQLIAQLVTASQAETAVRYDFEEDGVEQALLELQSVSFFLQQPLVVINNCTVFLSQGKNSAQGEALESYLQNPVSNRVLVLTVQADKLDERKKITKAAKRHLVVSCQTPKEAAALKMLQAYATEQAIQIQGNALAELWRRTGTVTLARNELHKVGLYAGGKAVTEADVRMLVTQTLEETVFDWVDHVIKGQLVTATEHLVDIERQGYDPLALLAMLARQLRLMWYAKALQQKGMRLDDIAKEVKAHPFALRVADRQSKKIPLAALERTITQAADIELDVKRGRRDPQHAIELFMLQCAKNVAGV